MEQSGGGEEDHRVEERVDSGELDSFISAHLELGEGEDCEGGEEEEGGLPDDDLDGVAAGEVQGGEHRQHQLRNEQDGHCQGDGGNIL